MKLMIPLSLFFLLWSGCEYRYTVTDREDFRDLDRGDPLLVWTTDRILYRFDLYATSDSALSGWARHKRGTEWVVEDSSTVLPWSQIVYIQGHKSSIVRGVLAATAIGFFVYSYADGFPTGNQLTAREDIGYYVPYTSGGKSSCPYVFSKRDTSFVLEGEVFGTAVGKSLECTTSLLLPSITGEKDSLQLRVANQRPETHYINSVQLYAVETNGGDEVALDQKGTAWPIRERRPPVAASDAEGNDISSLIGPRDGTFWTPDAGHGAESGEVDLIFTGAARHRTCSFMLTCINTPIAADLLHVLYEFLGDAYWDFEYQLEHNASMVDLMNRWYRKNAISVYVGEGDQWKFVTRFYQQGNAVPFDRMARIVLPSSTSDTLRLRLRMRPDLWRIDAVNIDWSDISALTKHAIPTGAAATSRGEDARMALQERDSHYTMLLPPEYIDLTFPAYRGAPENRVHYGVDVGGYMYEWPYQTKTTLYSYLGKIIPDGAKVGIVRYFMGQDEFILSR